MNRRRSISAIAFTLELLEPGGVGRPAPLRENELDIVLDRAPDGRVHLPGTSLAGALRAHVRAARGAQRADAWFGSVTGAGSQTVAVASPIWVGSSVLDSTTVPVHRWTTAIDRGRGAARHRHLRGAEEQPAEASFPVTILWEDATHGDVDDLAAMIAGWRPLLGRATSTGHGRCAVRDVRVGHLPLSTDAGLLSWLTTDSGALAAQIATDEPARTGPDRPLTHWSVRFRLAGPTLVSTTSTDETGQVVRIPLRDSGAPLLPGSSLKGVLRSRVELVLRSVGLSACETQRCGECLACGYFGFGGDDTRRASVGQRGRVRVLSARVVDQLDGHTVHTRVTTHVAIDRFTGGAAMRTGQGGLLYKVEAPDTGDVTLSLDVTELPDDERSLFGALVRIVVDDMHRGLARVGHSTTRGYGHLVVLDGHIDGLPSLTEARAALAAAVADAGVTDGGAR